MKKIGIFIFLGLTALYQANNAFAGYFVSTPINKCEVRITSTLQRGDSGDDVIRLQNLLVRSGYLHATPNGYFGYGTESALRAFQRDNFIPRTGKVGEMTRNAVNERMCDVDVFAPSFSSPSSLTTFVVNEDPFVQVINAPSSSSYTTSNTYSSPSIVATPSSVTVASTIVYNPYSGYGYGLTPASGSLTVVSPRNYTNYNEGDSIMASWYVTNLTSSTYTVSLESEASSQSKVIGVTEGTSFSLILSKELLDSVCSGACTYGAANTFRLVISTPVKDIAGNISTLRAVVSPLSIKRPYMYGGEVSIIASKNPVSSGETLKLYVNIPKGASWDAFKAQNYSVKVRAICPVSVSVSIVGIPCGGEFFIPFAPTYFQQEIPVMITNDTWYKQNVTFELSVMNSFGQVLGTSNAQVSVNGKPFSW